MTQDMKRANVTAVLAVAVVLGAIPLHSTLWNQLRFTGSGLLGILSTVNFARNSYYLLSDISQVKMPGHLGQKVLQTFSKGMGDLKSRASFDSQLPGKGIVNDDERNLCSPVKGTYPRLTKLADGSILAAFTQSQGNQRALRVSRSTDGGQCFGDWGEVTRGANELDNMFLIEVAPMTVLAAFRNHDRGPKGLSHFRITVCKSTDGGKSWKYASQAAEKGAPLGLWEPFMRMGRQGEVQLTYSQEFAPNDQRTMLVVSHDQGKSWTKPVCVEGEKEKIRDGMNGIAETKDSDGREALVMVFETNRYGPFNIEAVVSYDDGASWQHRHEVYVPRPGHNAGAPQIASFADGSLVVIFMTDEDSDKVEWVNHAATKVIFSGRPRKGKTHWSKPMLICKGSSFWPGIMAVDDFTALATYDCGGPRVKSINWTAK